MVYDRNPSVFSPAGPYAHRLAVLGIAMAVIAAIIFVGVLAILIIGLRRGPSHSDADDGPPPAVSARLGCSAAGC